MHPDAGNWETALGEVADLVADFRDPEAELKLFALIDTLKGGMDASPRDAERYFFWGRSLTLLDEPEQACLRFEQALQILPDHEGALWETISLLLDPLDKPEGAKALLEKKLLPLHPDNADYLEALASAETLIRRRAVPVPPPDVDPDLPAAPAG